MIDGALYSCRQVTRRRVPNVNVLVQRVESQVEARWLLRRWREDGENRPLVVQLRTDQTLRWVIPSQAENMERRFGSPKAYKWVMAYQINQRNGSWTETRNRYVYERDIQMILPVDDPLVRKARAWAVAQRLQGSE